MRNISEWSKDLRKALRKSNDLNEYVVNSLPDVGLKVRQQELQRLAQLIAEVELGLTLLHKIAPEEPAISVSALTSGYRFPVSIFSDENWQLVQKARFYLIRRKGNQWEQSLSEYINLPERIRIFQLTDINDSPVLIPTTIHPQRHSFYKETLSTTPSHSKRKIKLASTGYWYAKISNKGHAPVEVPINIPEAVANLDLSRNVAFNHIRQQNNFAQTITKEELLSSAREMDAKLAECGYEPENYDSRLKEINWRIYNESTDNFCDQNKELKLDKLLHIVGLLNVGKSTLLEILIYSLAKQGYRCALIVNDVVAQVRLASLFSHGLGIPATPILGSDRFQQLEKVYEPILFTKGEEIYQGATHPAWRWFNPICPLLALVQAEEKWEFGSEPCHNLYQKVNSINQNNPSEEEEEEEEETENNKYSTCPFYYQCPHHQLERDIGQSLVWVLTPASLIHTPIHRQLLEEKLTFAEAVYRECHFLFIDEADRVQVQFDEAFAPDEVLVDASGNSLLNQLGIKFANAIYNSDRRPLAAKLIADAKKANDFAQIATDIILPKLHNQPKLVQWLGSTPFTGRSVFAHIIRDILEPPLETNNQQTQPKLTRSERSQQRQKRIEAGLPPIEERRRRKQLMQTLEGFLQAPLNRRKGGELSDLAFTLLSGESDQVALAEIGDWLKRWLEAVNISLTDKTQFEEATRHLQFAILVTVLANRLSFVLDHLSALMRSQVIDFHDTSLSLVNRPPRDYLAIVPSSPVGNILGFRYSSDRRSHSGGKLEYFRYVGVGRYLLLNFPTLFAIDDWDGPHTVLISGTSYAPGTPAYHIQSRPTVLLEPASNNNQAGDTGISESEFFFTPQQSGGKSIALSGLPPTVRKKAVEQMVKAICHRPGQAENFLNLLFERLKELEKNDPKRWSDRQRLLLITNSYDEAALVELILKPLYRLEHIDSIAVLRRDNAPTDLTGIRRGKIRDLNTLPTQIVIAPLMALERGHNILNDERIAAFGAAVFLSRPMPIPDDWQTTVQNLNSWAIEKAENPSLYEAINKRGEPLTLTTVHSEFYKYAKAKMLDLNCRAASFQQLTDDERSVLCWTQLVSIWQIIGRLVRGGVPCMVHFLDAKFAPKSATGERDSEVTSVLVAMIKLLGQEIEGQEKRPYETVLAQALYGAFFNAIKQTKDLDYGI